MCNVPDYGVEEVSDHTVAMMLALAKKLPVLTRALREGDWGYGSTVPLSRFCESTVGLVGFGRIPQLVAKKLKGFGVAIRVCDPMQTRIWCGNTGRSRWNWTSFWRRAILSPCMCR